MHFAGNTILITGGSEGIGLEMARLLVRENTVIICGRGKDNLAKAKAELPMLVTEICDVTDEAQRNAFVERVLSTYPELNILVNNAGGRNVVDLTSGDGVIEALRSDTELNYHAPVSMCTRLLGHLRTRQSAAIVNITSGLVYIPKTAYPFYCAAKSALHSYTMSLRRELKGSDVRVFEVFMALVDTKFHKGGLPRSTRAISAEEAAVETLRGLARGKEDIYIGKSSLVRWLGFFAPDKGMGMVNRS